MKFNEKIINAIYGQCVADAVGNPWEFRSNINPEDVITYANTTDQLVISDDSQMGPLFGFEAIKNLTNYGMRIGSQVEYSFTDSYIDWLYTQTNDPECHRSFDRDMGLLSFKSMYSVQAPGNTCLSALETLRDGDTVKNDSMGCGSVMRLLPLVSLFYKYAFEEVVGFAQITGGITHKHKDNVPAIRRYMEVAYQIVNDIPVINIHTEVYSISELGDGWIAPEAVEMAIWAYCKAKDFDDLLRLSIAHSGDSDSVASIAGSLWGLSGREVPKKYISKLDSLDAIEWTIGNISYD